MPTGENILKKYDIMVFDGTNQRQEQGVMANSPKELAAIYAMSDEKIQIVREYEDEDCKKYGQFDPQAILKEMDTPMANGSLRGTGMMRISDEMKEMIEKTSSTMRPKPVETVPRGTSVVPGSFDGLIRATNPEQDRMNRNQDVTFFKVGNVECKIENGIVYQKKWARASEEDMGKIRIVFDKNGKDVPMSGKHVEILKWEVANSEEDKTGDTLKEVAEVSENED